VGELEGLHRLLAGPLLLPVPVGGEKGLLEEAMRTSSITLSVLLLAGCSGSLPEIAPGDVPAFVRTHRLAVVMFSKDLCPPCDVQESYLAMSAQELPGVAFAKVKAYDGLIRPTDANLVRGYSLEWTPTTVLHLDGKEIYRWTTLHGRDALDPVLRRRRGK